MGAGVGELSAHGHEEGVEGVDGGLALELDKAAVEASSELDHLASLLDIAPDLFELLGVQVEVLAGIHGVHGASLSENGGPFLSELALELVRRDVQLVWG